MVTLGDGSCNVSKNWIKTETYFLCTTADLLFKRLSLYAVLRNDCRQSRAEVEKSIIGCCNNSGER